MNKITYTGRKLSSCFRDGTLELIPKPDPSFEDLDTINYSDKIEIRDAEELRKLPQQPSVDVMLQDEKEMARVIQRAEEVHHPIQNITMNKGNGFLVGHRRTNSPVWASFITAEEDGKFVCDAAHRAMIQFYLYEDGSSGTDIIGLDNLERVRPCEWVTGKSVTERWVHIYDTMVRWAKTGVLG